MLLYSWTQKLVSLPWDGRAELNALVSSVNEKSRKYGLGTIKKKNSRRTKVKL